MDIVCVDVFTDRRVDCFISFWVSQYASPSLAEEKLYHVMKTMLEESIRKCWNDSGYYGYPIISSSCNRIESRTQCLEDILHAHVILFVGFQSLLFQ